MFHAAVLTRGDLDSRASLGRQDKKRCVVLPATSTNSLNKQSNNQTNKQKEVRDSGYYNFIVILELHFQNLINIQSNVCMGRATILFCSNAHAYRACRKSVWGGALQTNVITTFKGSFLPIKLTWLMKHNTPSQSCSLVRQWLTRSAPSVRGFK